MVILFLVNSLEPGRDGVGDYARLLAAELVRQNYPCCLLALNDSFVTQPTESSSVENGMNIPILRLPAAMNPDDRVVLAQNFRSRFPIDWVSLQFVQYGLNPKGIVRRWSRRIKAIVGDLPLHLMFHEIWLGAERSAGLKNRMIGAIQRHYIKKMVCALHPAVIHSSNNFYLSMLRDSGISATLLPLFGNIPIVAQAQRRLPAALTASLAYQGLGLRQDQWLGLFFGSMQPEWKAQPFFGLLLAAAQKARKRVCLVSVGRLGRGEAAWKKLQDDYSNVISFITLGEQPAEQVSLLLQEADFGLAAHPWLLIGKSGAVAAMLDHGLPVIITRDDFLPPAHIQVQPPGEILFHRCDSRLEAKLVAGLPRGIPDQRVKQVAVQMVRQLAG
jgi:hypothetical protein